MSQAEIIEVLKEEPDRWHTAKTLSERLDITKTTITCNLRKLRRYSEVRVDRPSSLYGCRGDPYRYKYKRSVLE